MFSSIATRSFFHPARFRSFSTSTRVQADFTHAVIGGGVVGLAIARKLQAREGASVLLIEKHGSVGTETSSRNSEVIHAGLYYGTDSLKTRLCLRGKEKLYELCQKHSIPHRNTGKWIVAQDDTQMEALQKVHDFARSIGVPTQFITKEEAKRSEPDVRAQAGVLESSSTGIVDSHSLMQYLEGDFQDQGGLCTFNTSVTLIEPYSTAKGAWDISTTDPAGAVQTISSETLINAAGLYAVQISNMVLAEQRKAFYAKGSYFSYSSSRPRPSTLIYPAPVPGHGGLGTHLTLDMSGRIRFGPDVEWTDSPTDYAPNTKNLTAAIDDIATYLPGIDRDAIQPDYVGIRPKLGKFAATSGANFQDFYIKKESETNGGDFVNLLAIESPGLTSCLAIAEEVERLLYG